MQTNKRLTKINQYGEVLYCGPRDSNSYENMGLYPRDMDEEQIELVLTRLYWFEDVFEDLQQVLHVQEKTMKLMEQSYEVDSDDSTREFDY